jgi:hypothetical protein
VLESQIIYTIGWVGEEKVFSFSEKTPTIAGANPRADRDFAWTGRATCGIIPFFNSSRIQVGWKSPGWQDSFMGEEL